MQNSDSYLFVRKAYILLRKILPLDCIHQQGNEAETVTSAEVVAKTFAPADSGNQTAGDSHIAA
jgi:hypothetical protein